MTEAELSRRADRAMRRAVEKMDPDLYRALAGKHPELYGPDTLERIRRDFPQFFRDQTPKG